uniref:NADH-ubiquinone oxidoreductase chain 4L n=1 Tax=Sympagella nux TaxID=76350 RepID=A6YHK7_9METZ|nr:NADH dehydrogenase subunit 4L [Sympagella nux]
MTHELISTTSTLILLISIYSILLNFRNLIILLITIEIMLLALCLILSTFSQTLLLTLSTIIILQILTIAAAETAIGLSILITYYRIRGTISIKSLSLLRG